MDKPSWDDLLQAGVAEGPKTAIAWLEGKTFTTKTDTSLGRGMQRDRRPSTGWPHVSQPERVGRRETGLWVGAVIHSKAKWSGRRKG